MISIIRPAAIPAKLSGDGATKTTANCTAFTNDPPTYSVRKAPFDFDGDVYGHPTVKSAIKNAQHGKCCYCEQNQKGQYGDVEHFRPKTAYKIRRRQALTYPGYYWLCYEWTNLLFACELCNTGYKGNLFPLVDEGSRVTTHTGTITDEEPYLIDPVKINPRKHICFKKNLIDGITPKGKKTIEICGLDRADLNDSRQEMIDNLNARIVVWAERATMPAARVAAAVQYLLDAQLPTAPFSSAAIDYLAPFDFQEP